MATWRTMFSRTTIASSISRPMHRLSAIIVMKFSVKPKAYTAMKLLITAMGSVSPVMMVLRHECRNRNTMATVSSAPSTSVLLQAVERAAHPVAAGVDQAQLHVGRHLLAHLVHRLLHRVAGADDVGVLLLEDVEDDRASGR